MSLEKNDLTNDNQSVSRRAYDLLRPFAQSTEFTSLVESLRSVHYRLGSHEGVAVLMVASQFDPLTIPIKKGEAANYDHATLEAHRIVDNLMGFFSTALVVLTLSFSISFMILQIMTTTFSASIGPLGGGITFFEQWERYDDFLYVCHWIECIFLVISICSALRGITLGFMFYCALAVFMTDLEDKLTFLMNHLTKLSDTFMFAWCSVSFLGMSLPFVGARTSPVFCMVSLLVLVAFYFGWHESKSLGIFLANQQLKRAKKIMS